MAVRWVINPVITVSRIGDGTKVASRFPKVSTMEDPGNPRQGIDQLTGLPRTGNHKYAHVSVISSGQPGEENDWCLSQVWGEDFGPLDADPEIIDVLEFDYDGENRINMLELPLNAAGINQAKRARIEGRLRGKGADVRNIKANTKVYEVLERLGKVFRPRFDPRVERTRHIPRTV